MTNRYSTITLTFSECVENHIHNQQIGSKSTSGFTVDMLKQVESIIPTSKYYDMIYEEHEAGILIIPNGVDLLTYCGGSDDLLSEQRLLTPDTKYWDNRRQQVLNKHARHNLCFADFNQQPDYDQGMGTVVSFQSQPVLSMLRQGISDLIGMYLFAEGNYYHNGIESGIGFHGDTERMYVIGVRLGKSMPLIYQWFQDSQPIGMGYNFILSHGDIYIMSEKATGYDWKKRTFPTLRHSAGTEKYTQIKKRSCENSFALHTSLSTGKKIINPLTGRLIDIGGRVYKKLVKDGIIAPI